MTYRRFKGFGQTANVAANVSSDVPSIGSGITGKLDVPSLCDRVQAALANYPGALDECGLCASCGDPADEGYIMPEDCPVVEDCPDCPDCPELKEDTGGGIAWWWLVVAAGAGIGTGYFAAKQLAAKKP